MPREETRDTKAVILSVALKLFSERGYDGVGIRDIAKEIGIRDSALYKHYSGKQDIFNSIIKDIERRYKEEVPASDVFTGTNDKRGDLFRICITMFRFYLETEYGSRLRRMLTIEQYRTSEAGRFFRELLIENGLEYISGVFTELIKDGVYVEADPMVMALQFYTPLYLLLTMHDNQPDKYEEAFSMLEKHISQFDKIHSRGDAE